MASIFLACLGSELQKIPNCLGMVEARLPELHREGSVASTAREPLFVAQVAITEAAKEGQLFG